MSRTKNRPTAALRLKDGFREVLEASAAFTLFLAFVSVPVAEERYSILLAASVLFHFTVVCAVCWGAAAWVAATEPAARTTRTGELIERLRRHPDVHPIN